MNPLIQTILILLVHGFCAQQSDQSLRHGIRGNANHHLDDRSLDGIADHMPSHNGVQNEPLVGHKRDDTSAGLLLSSHPSCAEDIARVCGRTGISLDNNLSVLTCVQNKEEDMHLSADCHHLMWSYKRNLTNDNHFASVAKSLCNRLITENADCLETEDEKVLSPSANLMSCLIERLVPETDVECKAFLTKMELIIFSDYRLIHKFTDFCAKDIERQKCGRIDTNSESTHSQGSTIECLEKSMDQLTDSCQHQILRIAELQSDDFHLDRSLYFACREDREKFCHRIQSGDGRVYRCLMRHKLERDLSRNCREKLFQREMLAVRDYKVAHGLAKACKQDIKTYRCREATSDQKEIRLAQILLCLENAVAKNLEVDAQCRTEMLTHRTNLLQNYNLTPDLVSDCDTYVFHTIYMPLK
jgi:Golgi apparatus protein 1